MTPEALLQIINDAVDRDPRLLHLSIIRKAIDGLERGQDTLTVIEWLSVDLDKLDGDLQKFLMQAHKCVEAFRRLHALNLTVNNGRGSQTVRNMLASLERFDIHTARTIFHNDGDKVRQYDRLYAAIEGSEIGCRMHGRPYYCNTCINTE